MPPRDVSSNNRRPTWRADNSLWTLSFDKATEALTVTSSKTGITYDLAAEGGAHPDLSAHELLGLITEQDLADHAATAHGGSHPDLDTHNTLGLATQAELDDHEGASDPHVQYERESQKGVAGGYASLDGSGLVPDAQIPSTIARDSELPDLAGHVGAADPHTGYALSSELTTHEGTAHGGSLPAGLILMWGGLISAIPTGYVLCDGNNGTPDLRAKFVKGSAAGVDPGVTGGAQTHTHAGHSNHVFTQPTATAETAHTHAYTQVVNHVHPQAVNSATTGGLSGYTPDTSSNTSTTSGYSTGNPTGGVASGTTGAGSSHTHTISGGAVDAHSAHDSPSSEPPYYALCFIQKT